MASTKPINGWLARPNRPVVVANPKHLHASLRDADKLERPDRGLKPTATFVASLRDSGRAIALFLITTSSPRDLRVEHVTLVVGDFMLVEEGVVFLLKRFHTVMFALSANVFRHVGHM